MPPRVRDRPWSVSMVVVFRGKLRITVVSKGKLGIRDPPQQVRRGRPTRDGGTSGTTSLNEVQATIVPRGFPGNALVLSGFGISE